MFATSTPVSNHIPVLSHVKSYGKQSWICSANIANHINKLEKTEILAQGLSSMEALNPWYWLYSIPGAGSLSPLRWISSLRLVLTATRSIMSSVENIKNGLVGETWDDVTGCFQNMLWLHTNGTTSQRTGTPLKIHHVATLCTLHTHNACLSASHRWSWMHNNFENSSEDETWRKHIHKQTPVNLSTAVSTSLHLHRQTHGKQKHERAW